MKYEIEPKNCAMSTYSFQRFAISFKNHRAIAVGAQESNAERVVARHHSRIGMPEIIPSPDGSDGPLRSHGLEKWQHARRAAAVMADFENVAVQH